MKVRISSPSRLHFGLIGFSSVLGRKYGGIGLATDLQTTDICVRTTSEQRVKVQSNDCDVVSFVSECCERLDLSNLEIEVLSCPPRHVGLGSGTSMALSILEANAILNGKDRGEQRLVDLSKRGRTSGVGVKTYFAGGLCIDYGQPNDGVYLPSSATSSSQISQSLHVGRHLWPEDWPLAIARLSTEKTISDESEVSFYDNVGKVQSHECFENAYHLGVEVVCGALERDFSQLRQALVNASEKGFKKLEMGRLPQTRRLIRSVNKSNERAAILSSLGPSFAIFFRNIDALERFRIEYEDLLDIEYGFANSSGRRIWRIL